MSEPPYATKGLPPAPAVSMVTMAMGGLLVDVFGLDELPGPDAAVTCLWLLHPRTRTRARMHDMARRAVDGWNRRQQQGSRRRGLLALAFDMPNHGSRLVSATANETWRDGNERHAVDMAAVIRAARCDLSGLMDLVAGYLGRRVDAHVALGWSLGGHVAWQSVFGEPRLHAVVVIVGCPDYLGLMTHRAREARLATGSTPLLGSNFFPPDLMAACAAHDPRGLLFGPDVATPLPAPPLPPAEQARLRATMDARGVGGKRVLVCSGADDALVPYARSEPLLAVLADAAGGWYGGPRGLVLRDRVYEGAGHCFSADMVRDALDFLLVAVEEGPRRAREGEGAGGAAAA